MADRNVVPGVKGVRPSEGRREVSCGASGGGRFGGGWGGRRRDAAVPVYVVRLLHVERAVCDVRDGIGAFQVAADRVRVRDGRGEGDAILDDGRVSAVARV